MPNLHSRGPKGTPEQPKVHKRSTQESVERVSEGHGGDPGTVHERPNAPKGVRVIDFDVSRLCGKRSKHVQKGTSN